MKFLRQHPVPIDNNGRETFFVVDFYCAERRLVVEVDGPIHKFQKKSDEERCRILAERGLTVLRLTNEEVERDLEVAIEKIRRSL